MEVRELRNEFAYDYENDPIETSEKINKIFQKKDELEKFFNDIKGFLEEKGFNL